MLGHIILREIKYNILSLRLQITMILSLIIFCFGSVAYIKNYSESQNEYKAFHQQLLQTLRERSEDNITRLATRRTNYILSPRTNAFMSDTKEKYTPNRFEYNAYNVFGFSVRQGSANPYLSTFQELNWAFIISIIISFTVFLFTFDAISGEKESKMLSMIMAHPVSRGTVLFGKYISTIITSFLILLPGVCISLIILLLSGAIIVTPAILGEFIGFIFAAVIFIACIAAIGILCSVVTQSANVSLLLTLTIWLLFVVVIPNTAVFWADTVFPIEKTDLVEQRASQSRQAINDAAPPGSWNSSGDPFYPAHELRAANQTNLMNSDKQIWDAYYNDMFRQYEKVQYLTLLSPISLFEYLTEAVIGGGYFRFQKAWQDIHVYQEQFLKFFKEKDQNDPDSPHWYNPYESFSTTRKPVNFEEVPVFNEKSLSAGERFRIGSTYFLILSLYMVVIFFLAFVRFIKYDVR
jgi:ABC-type transport system involved in multi-copper enzyme maturation permease subunit